MSKLNEAKVIPRYMLVSVLMTLVSCCVLGKAFYIMTAEKDYWAEAAKQSARDSVKLEATRGNILSCDGRLMATTMPQYKIFMDFETLRSNPTDTAFADSLDAICQGLNEIFPEKPAEEFKAELKKGYAKRSRVWPVWKKRVDYDTWMEVGLARSVSKSMNITGSIRLGRWQDAPSATSTRSSMADACRDVGSKWPSTPCCEARRALATA